MDVNLSTHWSKVDVIIQRHAILVP